jgi:hypothetical protein
LGKGFGIFGFGVNLGDQDGGFGDEVVSEGFPDGGQGLAVCGFVSFELFKMEEFGETYGRTMGR